MTVFMKSVIILFRIYDLVVTSCLAGKTVWKVIGVYDNHYWCLFEKGLGTMDDEFQTFTASYLKLYNGEDI